MPPCTRGSATLYLSLLGRLALSRAWHRSWLATRIGVDEHAPPLNIHAPSIVRDWNDMLSVLSCRVEMFRTKTSTGNIVTFRSSSLPSADKNNKNKLMRGSDASDVFVPPGKRCFALLMRTEPLVEPNVLDTFLQPSIVKIRFTYLFSFFLLFLI